LLAFALTVFALTAETSAMYRGTLPAPVLWDEAVEAPVEKAAIYLRDRKSNLAGGWHATEIHAILARFRVLVAHPEDSELPSRSWVELRVPERVGSALVAGSLQSFAESGLALDQIEFHPPEDRRLILPTGADGVLEFPKILPPMPLRQNRVTHRPVAPERLPSGAYPLVRPATVPIAEVQSLIDNPEVMIPLLWVAPAETPRVRLVTLADSTGQETLWLEQEAQAMVRRMLKGREAFVLASVVTFLFTSLWIIWTLQDEGVWYYLGSWVVLGIVVVLAAPHAPGLTRIIGVGPEVKHALLQERLRRCCVTAQLDREPFPTATGRRWSPPGSSYRDMLRALELDQTPGDRVATVAEGRVAAAAHIRERLKGMNPETRTAFLRAYPLASLRSSGNHRWLHDQVIGPALCHWSPDELEEGEQLAPLNRHCR
jgi:hypothetical protein